MLDYENVQNSFVNARNVFEINVYSKTIIDAIPSFLFSHNCHADVGIILTFQSVPFALFFFISNYLCYFIQSFSVFQI